MEARILWADDEIDLLKPHILFLEQKGYIVETSNNGRDAVDMAKETHFDIIFLDENMPGYSGLETLALIKDSNPLVPVIMITKSEEEHIMEEAIGGQISDYLIKPVNPNQILLSLKKNLNTKELVSQKNTSDYQTEFRQIGMRLNDRLDFEEWKEVYKTLVNWEVKLESSGDNGMEEVFDMQKKDANTQFCKYIESNYEDWVTGEEEGPIMSNNLLEKKVFNVVGKEPVFLIVIDNLRFDQWKILQPLISEYFNVESEELYYSILPTATQYARNAMFAGLMPIEIEKKHPDLWLNENDEGGKNMHEEALLAANLKRHGKQVKMSYHKVIKLDFARRMVDKFNDLLNNDFNVLVYNFVDMLSHARTEMEVIKELADDEAAYRALTKTWFEHSPLKEMLQKIAAKKIKTFLTTDHGTIKVDNPVQIIGDRQTNTNLRYKVGKNLNYKEKEVSVFKSPKNIKLPQENMSSSYVFAKENDFFAYPNNYNHYANYYKNTFQHGGISLEEVIIPFIELTAK
ncbi:two-component system response regulator [Putridiphycobacter roseus]|uniref:Two-component system response regulator n=1 Tax=Putridiphycobacter roseus TaxID=2219161 RepID=A0A2W1NCR9_9FLAO|nr:bifunctional response regulator/alkaline phosphatase family protein [Putridiphycobacter roseus]PZE16873.1 two-component system response regulator [Putridiphycobacter roseus]